MTTPRRSTTGCTACKNRRKKCDEGKPQCQRCLTSGIPCGYDFIEYPSSASHLIQRTKPAPRPAAELLAKAALNANGTSGRAVLSSIAASPSIHLTSNDSVLPAWAKSSTTRSNEMSHGMGLGTSSGGPIDVLPSSARSTSPPRLFSDLSQVGYVHPASSFVQPILEVPDDNLMRPTGLASRTEWPCYGDSDIDSEEYDPERIHANMSLSPTMDKNLKENTLPFVLQCYARWAIVSVFEPLKIVHAMKGQIVQQFSSEDNRRRWILMANVMDAFGKQLVVGETRLSILTQLTLDMRASCLSFMVIPSSEFFVAELDRKHAMQILDRTLEIMTLQIYTQPMSAHIQLMEEAAPVFRRACSEPPGQSLRLPNILLEPGLNLRHYASIDIMTSALTGRPTFFKYDVPFSLELCEQILQAQEESGLYWLHGVPDQFIMIIAWINTLREIPGIGANSELLSQIERDLPQIKMIVDHQGDPALRIGRVVVQECWRQAIFIYLYMPHDHCT
ncbi:unnamed protein product [Rhizoctonia solani]|uniref:Zn(2)-C6 fungal-type domain-containing protein n=1 Tax=Rhizoctonia solani TaxID=456999 RepID=A0A8H3CKM3_9AGAM|nr:unnamed protein product [Rhizoctonia solani]